MSATPCTCEHCGRPVAHVADLRQIRRTSGCRMWVCRRCDPIGTVDVIEQVARDRAAHAGGPRLVGADA